MNAETLGAIQYFRLECTVPQAVANAETIIKALEKAEWSAVETAWALAGKQRK